jgi:hypothetical protein
MCENFEDFDQFDFCENCDNIICYKCGFISGNEKEIEMTDDVTKLINRLNDLLEKHECLDNLDERSVNICIECFKHGNYNEFFKLDNHKRRRQIVR